VKPARWASESTPARAAVVAGLTALIVALPSIVNGFVLDDGWIVARHDVVHNLADLRSLLTAPYWPGNAVLTHGAMWRPVTLFAFAVEWTIGGGAPLPFHAANIVLYAVVAALVAWLGTRLVNPTAGVLAGVLFAVQPAHVEVTANVVGQGELLAAAGYLAAVSLLWLRADPAATGRRRTAFGVLIPLVALLAVGAKEHAITLPGAMLVVLWWRAQRDGHPVRLALRREAVVLTASVVLLALYVVARSAILGGATAAGSVASGLDPHSQLQRAWVMLPVTLKWFQVLFVPLWLSADYGPQHLVAQPGFGTSHLLALATWLLVAVSAWTLRRRAPGVGLGVIWFLLTISVVANVVAPLEILFAERLLFLPSVGWAIALGALGALVIAERPNDVRVMAGTVAVVAVLFAARSAVRARVWRSEDVLFAQMLREAPQSFRGHWARGAQAFAAGDSVTGDSEMRRAIALNPDHPQPMDDLGRIYAATRRYEPAVPMLARVVERDSSRLGTALALALSLGRTGRPDEAIALLDAMTRLHGENQSLLVVRADALGVAGDYAGALAALERVVAREPTAWRHRVMAADGALAAGDCRAAAAQADTAAALAPAAAAPDLERLAERLANRNPPCK